jgi:hypothetical protein
MEFQMQVSSKLCVVGFAALALWLGFLDVASGQCPTGCAASITYHPQVHVLTNASCNAVTNPNQDFGLTITVNNVVSGNCHPSFGECVGVCQFDVTVTYENYGSCQPLQWTGSNCQTNVGGTVSGTCSSCPLDSQTVYKPCGQNCTMQYAIWDPSHPTDVAIARVDLNCPACP